MSGMEPKRLALIRIWQILKEYSDCDYPLTQEDIAQKLKNQYDIEIERKAIGRNVSLLKEAGVEVETGRSGSYLIARDFEDAELRMIIDGILSSKYISVHHSKDLIERVCNLSNAYFRSSVKHIHSVNDWGKTANQALFYNIEQIDAAIEAGKQIQYDYNKYGIDKKLHKTSSQRVSPYLMVLNNQRYYLMAYNEHWEHMVFHRMDRITNVTVTDTPAKPIRSVPGYKTGINYKELSSARPYMYTDKAEHIEFYADVSIIDQVIDWFGTDIKILKDADETRVKVILSASPNAMEHWAMQYINYVEVTAPKGLREKIRAALKGGLSKYDA